MLSLSILDQSPIADNATGGQALRNSLDLAALGDRLGYRRFWMAEHHATPALASASPEIMLAAAAERTSTIRLGTGGIMLPHYSPFKVAETFSMLAGLTGGRIDLGVGRAPGSDGRTAYALQQDRRTQAPNDFPPQLGELLAYFDRALPPTHPFAALADTLPGGADVPEVWLLGSSPDSARWAAATGLPYCFADFINSAGTAITAGYRDAFEPSRALSRPHVAVAAWVVCADTDAEATRLAASARMMFAHLMAGKLIAVPSPERAASWLAANPLPPALRRRTIEGSPATCRAGIEALAADYGADEVFLVNILHDHGARRASYELIAEAFGLTEPLARAA